MAAVVLSRVGKDYPGVAGVVRELSVTIASGEFLVFVGPSGCGKSTTLRMIAGLEDISRGTIEIAGRVVNDVPPKAREIAMVFQNYALYPHLSVRENIAFPLRLAKENDAEVNRKVDEAARVLELTELLDRKPAALSGGQRQRVAMGRAIVREPQAFLFDEPLSNLDAKLRVQMRTEIARLQKRFGTTTVYVTHDQTEAMTLGDRVAVLRKGVVQQVASPRELYNRPTNLFVAGFIGSPSMNFLPGPVRDGKLELPMVTVDLPDEIVARVRSAGDGQEFIAGIRPEHFQDAGLITDEDRRHGPTFRTRVDVVEWMGSELFAYFPVSGSANSHEEMVQLANELDLETGGGDESQVVARLDAASDAREGQEVEIWLDARQIHLFDPETGENLTADIERLGDTARTSRGG
jgi:multiple sugar transport system ATP-binding protein